MNVDVGHRDSLLQSCAIFFSARLYVLLPFHELVPFHMSPYIYLFVLLRVSLQFHSFCVSITLSNDDLSEQLRGPSVQPIPNLHPNLICYLELVLCFSYSPHPRSPSLDILYSTSCSCLCKKLSMASISLGMPADRIRAASRPAFIPLLIATVATGIPRYSFVRQHQKMERPIQDLPASARYCGENPLHPKSFP